MRASTWRVVFDSLVQNCVKSAFSSSTASSALRVRPSSLQPAPVANRPVLACHGGSHKRGHMAKRKTSRVGARDSRLRAARSGGQAGAGGGKTARKQVRKVGTKARKPAARPARQAPDVLLAPLKGATRRTVGHVQLEVGRAGAARVKRMIYPAGFRWSVDMKPV